MPVYYFVLIPTLPREVAHQDNTVQLIEYVAQEGRTVDRGTPIAVVENWWSVLQIEATSKGYLSKIFFDRGTVIKIGDPIAIITCDPEDAPRGRSSSALSVLEIKHQKQ